MQVTLQFKPHIIKQITRSALCSYWAAAACDGHEVTEKATAEVFYLTEDKLTSGLALLAVHAPKHFADVLADNRDGRVYQCDGTTGDLLLQYACFGKVVYA